MLHTVNKSPFERNTLESCLSRALPGSAVLLIEDAVYAADAVGTLAEGLKAAAGRVDLFVLGPDLALRGLDPAHLVPGVRVVDYGGFVDLAIERGTVQAWL